MYWLKTQSPIRTQLRALELLICEVCLCMLIVPLPHCPAQKRGLSKQCSSTNTSSPVSCWGQRWLWEREMGLDSTCLLAAVTTSVTQLITSLLSVLMATFQASDQASFSFFLLQTKHPLKEHQVFLLPSLMGLQLHGAAVSLITAHPLTFVPLKPGAKGHSPAFC